MSLFSNKRIMLVGALKRTTHNDSQNIAICEQERLGKVESSAPSQREEDSEMDFQNANPLNMKLNKLSGNLLPMTDLGSSFTLFWKLHGEIVIMTQLLKMIVLICGCAHVSRNKLIHNGTIYLAIYGEMVFMITQIHVRRDLVRQLIRRLNGILHTADEDLKNIVTMTLRSVQIPLIFYTTVGVISTIVWCSSPLLNSEEKSVYWNEDYMMPSFFPNEPHSRRIFIMYNLFLTFTSMYGFLKKVAVDVYMIYLVLLMTAQYRYIKLKIAMIFRNEQKHAQGKSSSKINRMHEREMIELCHYHHAIIDMMFLLRKLLASNFSLIYVINILQFFSLIVRFNKISSMTFYQGISTFFYTLGLVVQLFIMCSCVQTLLNASTEMTDEAFHEDWYSCKPSIKRLFLLIMMANNLRCRIAKIEAFNLSLPSFVKILNQAYSIAVVFSKFS